VAFFIPLKYSITLSKKISMKKFALILVALSVSVATMAQPPKGAAKKGMTFGVKTTAADAVTPAELPALLKDKESATVKVKGKIVEVCKAEGCWVRMETPEGAMLVKMKDHSFKVPLAMNGKTVVATGIATFKETSVETLKHYAEDAGKSKDEIDAIKEPKKEIVLQATGIIVVQ
jgi:hypothetical protein